MPNTHLHYSLVKCWVKGRAFAWHLLNASSSVYAEDTRVRSLGYTQSNNNSCHAPSHRCTFFFSKHALVPIESSPAYIHLQHHDSHSVLLSESQLPAFQTTLFSCLREAAKWTP
jgi:hypothetical protein